jgi:dynein light intermediate chain
MRVRDELKMTLAAYETIYQSSITYGLRKQVESEEGNDAL